MTILKMAWRNVWRNYRRSSITIAAMALALFVELLYAGMVGGLVYGMEDDATAYELGDVQIFARGYPERPSIYETVPDADRLMRALEAAGYRATARLYGGGLAAAEDLSAGVAFVGIDPARDAATMDLDDALAEGAWLDADDPKGVVIGRGLSRTLGVGLGDEIVVLSQAADGGIANDLFKVRGILFAVAGGLDRGAILMPEATFRELMAFPEGVHRVFVRKPRERSLVQAAEQVAAITTATLGDQVEVRSWKQINPWLSQYIDSAQAVVVVVYLIVYLAVGILILNAMLMAVFERIRELGVLKAIGFTPAQVLSMMLLEGLIQAVVATAIGVLLALPAMAYLQVYGIDVGVLGGMQLAGLTMPSVWKGHYTLATTQVPVIALFGVVLAAIVYPAARAAWIEPVQAMRHQ